MPSRELQVALYANATAQMQLGGGLKPEAPKPEIRNRAAQSSSCSRPSSVHGEGNTRSDLRSSSCSCPSTGSLAPACSKQLNAAAWPLRKALAAGSPIFTSALACNKRRMISSWPCSGSDARHRHRGVLRLFCPFASFAELQSARASNKSRTTSTQPC